MGISFSTKVKYWFIQAVWNLGQKLREWACVAQGGTHDTIGKSRNCVVCGKEVCDA